MELVGDTMKYKAVKYDCLSRTQQKRNIRGTRWASFGKKKKKKNIGEGSEEPGLDSDSRLDTILVTAFRGHQKHTLRIVSFFTPE